PIGALIAGAGDWTDGGVAERRLRDREGDGRPHFRIGHFLGTLEGREFAALEEEHAIRRLRENPLRRAPRPLLVSGELRERLGPVGDDFVRAGLILSTLFA